MAYIDLDEDERAAPAPMGGGSAPAQAGGAPAGKAGTGFVNFGSLMGLNEAPAQQMADAVAGDLASRATPQAAANPIAASDVRARASVLGQSGPGAALGELYGNGRAYTSGEQAMDSALTGGVAGGTLRSVAGRYGGFGSLLGLPAQTGGGSAGSDSQGGGGPRGGPRTMPTLGAGLRPDVEDENDNLGPDGKPRRSIASLMGVR